jgi:hypothetical protein
MNTSSIKTTTTLIVLNTSSMVVPLLLAYKGYYNDHYAYKKYADHDIEGGHDTQGSINLFKLEHLGLYPLHNHNIAYSLMAVAVLFKDLLFLQFFSFLIIILFYLSPSIWSWFAPL